MQSSFPKIATRTIWEDDIKKGVRKLIPFFICQKLAERTQKFVLGDEKFMLSIPKLMAGIEKFMLGDEKFTSGIDERLLPGDGKLTE